MCALTWGSMLALSEGRRRMAQGSVGNNLYLALLIVTGINTDIRVHQDAYFKQVRFLVSNLD